MQPSDINPDLDNSHQPVVSQSARQSRKGLLAIAAIVLILVVGVATLVAIHSNKPSTTATSKTVISKLPAAQVNITSSGFVPANITVRVGQAVTWINQDTAPHWVASDPYPTDNTLASFNARQNMSSRDSFTYIFDKAGTYTYHDNLNPYSLKGTVTVRS